MSRFLVQGIITAYVEAPDETRAEECLASALEDMTNIDDVVYDWESIDTETLRKLVQEEWR